VSNEPRDISERLNRLSPEQRRLVREQLRRNAGSAAGATGAEPNAPARLSLYFFPQMSAMTGTEYYAFLLRACQFADGAGFHAAWFPERHFVDFGGNHPNPSVTAAAVAACTRRLELRAGSVAAPLHHPVRVAEEWAVVDNISGGRVGISFASGWHKDDFVLARDPFTARKTTLLRSVEQVRRLWAGDALSFTSTAGEGTMVTTCPRPVRAELPVWLTAAGNPETFEAAGAAGYGVMTALLGQTMGQLGENITRYRKNWSSAGHPGHGDVVVMVHAYVSDAPDLERVLRPALYAYLSSFRAQTGADGRDQQVLLEAAFQDYLAGPSLLGTEAKARSVLSSLAEAGADEVGCLIDFGLPGQAVLDGLPGLARLLPSARGTSAPQAGNNIDRSSTP
jgi:natural product biosynthesis luciferase-like monooxygenase protein